MIYWLVQFRDLLVYDTLHMFFVFGSFCWLVWLVRVLTSARYAPFKGARPNLAVSVLVPTYQEDINALEANLATLLENTSSNDEVLLVFDERDETRSKLSLSHPRLRIFLAPRGKRAAIRVGLENAKNPIFLLTGSDTRIGENTISEILKPFADLSVGGVTGRVVPAVRNNVGAKCYRWSLCLRNLIVYPGMGRSGVVHVLNGECYAARTKLARSFLDDFVNQQFLGRKFDSGDDGWMTTLLLRAGYRTVYQSTAVAETEPPKTFAEFLRQQMRWNRNSTRRTLYAVGQGWAWRRGFLYPFHLVVTLVKTPLWIAILLAALFFLIAGGNGAISTYMLEPYWSDWRILFFAAGIVLVRGLRGLPYLLQEPRAVAFLPLYAILAPFVLAPLRMYSMITARNSNWMTRGDSKTQGVSIVGSASIIVLVCAFAFLASAYPAAAICLALIAEDDADAY